MELMMMSTLPDWSEAMRAPKSIETSCSGRPLAAAKRELLRSIDELGDVQQFHVWSDSWADSDEWRRGVRALKDEGLSTFRAPIGELAIIMVFAAFAGVLAAIMPARRAAKIDILDAISYE